MNLKKTGETPEEHRSWRVLLGMQLSTPRGLRKLNPANKWNPWVKEDHSGSAFLQRACIRKEFTAGLWRVIGLNWLGQPAGNHTTFVAISAINCTAATGAPSTEEYSTFPASLTHHVRSWFCRNAWSYCLLEEKTKVIVFASYKLLWVHLLFHRIFFHSACRQQPVVFCAYKQQLWRLLLWQ